MSSEILCICVSVSVCGCRRRCRWQCWVLLLTAETMSCTYYMICMQKHERRQCGGCMHISIHITHFLLSIKAEGVCCLFVCVCVLADILNSIIACIETCLLRIQNQVL